MANKIPPAGRPADPKKGPQKKLSKKQKIKARKAAEKAKKSGQTGQASTKPKPSRRDFNKATLGTIAALLGGGGGALAIWQASKDTEKTDSNDSTVTTTNNNNNAPTLEEVQTKIQALNKLSFNELSSITNSFKAKLDAAEDALRPKPDFKLPPALIGNSHRLYQIIKDNLATVAGKKMKILHPSEEKWDRYYSNKYKRFAILLPEEHNIKDIALANGQLIEKVYKELPADYLFKELTIANDPFEPIADYSLKDYLTKHPGNGSAKRPHVMDAVTMRLQKENTGRPQLIPAEHISSQIKHLTLKMFATALASHRTYKKSVLDCLKNLSPQKLLAKETMDYYLALLVLCSKKYNNSNLTIKTEQLKNQRTQALTSEPFAFARVDKAQSKMPSAVQATKDYLKSITERSMDAVDTYDKYIQNGSIGAGTYGSLHIREMANALQKKGIGVIIPSYMDNLDPRKK